ncbi:hypothetical protein CAPTEDRAFT_171307 [Capitella teleta]|uniref:CCR4-NOT transcription complex subunit 10 n=1 Tax=Capitella teleta TaxID=283909 RepID=R7T3A5_CAPTE|nr:hypothetical protein CAPTEDRAFT_171307 [Capitella teleta]|eukprot:ELT87157.1 hypothetical protein CAPTEDRAFT_171307 [Capitella teleta]
MSQGDTKQSSAATSLSAATEQEQEQAKKALHEFERGNLEHCMGILNKLCSGGHAHDPKVMHNKAVTEYLKSKKMDEFTKSLNHVFSKSHVHMESLAGLEDVDQCVMCYNLALIHVRTRQPFRALALLDKLIQFLEPLEENFTRKILFLTIELFLCTQQPERALGLLTLVDKSLLNGAKQQSPDKDGVKENPAPCETWRVRASVYRALSYLMLKSLKSCRRELKSLVNVSTMSLPVTYLKAHFEHMRGNYRKAVKILSSAPNPTSSDSYPSIYYNNMAVLHFHMKKPHLAAFYLRKASQENASRTGYTDDIASEFTSDHYDTSLPNIMLYNMGVSLLHCAKPKPAFECLIQSVHAFPSNPRLWLRLAECCIMLHKKSNDNDRDLSKRLSVIQGSVGSGVHRKILLGSSVSSSRCASSDRPSLPSPSLEFASLALSNALTLLTEFTKDKAAPSEADVGESGEMKTEVKLMPAMPSAPMRCSEVHNLHCSVLASSAYVALCLNNCVMALEYSSALLKRPRLSGAHRYLGHMYKAEALVALDHIADAVQHLNPEAVSEISCAFPEHSQEQGDKNGDEPGESRAACALYPWYPADLSTAKALMQYNLASAHAIRDEQDKALQNLSMSMQTVGLPLPAQMYYLKLYLELMDGRKKTVHNIIKEHFGHVTPSRP